jgi:hypothetical protein
MMSDTDPAVVEMLIERWCAMSPGEKWAQAFELNRIGERLSRAGVMDRYPDATEHETKMRVFALRIPRDVMIAAYGWDPDVEGR